MRPHAHRFAGTVVLAAAAVAGTTALPAGASSSCEGADAVSGRRPQRHRLCRPVGAPYAVTSTERVAVETCASRGTPTPSVTGSI